MLSRKDLFLHWEIADMNRTIAYTVAVTLAVAVVLQALFGNPDTGMFAFPVNAAVLLVLVGGLFVLNREAGGSRFVAALASGRAAVTVIVLTALCCLPVALWPAIEFQRSWIFDAVMLLTLAVLLLATLRYRGTMRLRFRLNHAGLFIFAAALFFGSADMQRLRAAVDLGESTDVAYDEQGSPHSLGYTVTLESFEADFYDNNQPEEFRAVVSVDGRSRMLRVNHPWRKSWRQDIYLAGYDIAAGSESRYCVLEIVVQPWKYAALAGLLMLLAGSVAMIWGGRQRVNKKEADK